MSERATQVLEEALQLSLAERAVVVDQLLISLEQTDPSLDQLWAEEAEERIRAFEAGEIEAISADEVFAELASP